MDIKPVVTDLHCDVGSDLLNPAGPSFPYPQGSIM